MWQFLLLVGFVFSLIAAAMAFLITYEEYSHHQLPRAELRKRSFEMAGVTLAFFLVVTVVAAVGLSNVVSGR